MTQSYRLPVGPSSSPNAREILQAVYTLALTWTVTNNVSYAQHAAALVWNATVGPSQWDVNGTAQLNTGEMLHAAAMGYDWFFHFTALNNKRTWCRL